MGKKKIVVIIQARMTSTRLPGKVLMEIEGKPMLWHVVNRLKHSKKIDDIILAIPDTKENDQLERFVQNYGLKCFRGSEEDVLSRYYETAKKNNCDIVVRATSDCPLIDPRIVDVVIEKHLSSEADYTSNFLKRTFPRGLDTEAFNFKVLERAYKGAKEIYEREHVTSYIYEHPELFKLQNVETRGKLMHPEFRLTVDTKEDLKLIGEIYKYLYNPEEIFHIQDVINLLIKHPELTQININVQQKELKE